MDDHRHGEREVLRSASNPAIARVRAALRGRAEGLCVLEGDRLVDEALGLGLVPELLLVAADRTERLAALEAAGARPRAVDPELLDRVGSLKHGPGVLALVPEPAPRPMGDLTALVDAVPGPALVLVVAGVADPVNLGALARSAEAAGAACLVWVTGGVSPWNPRALRGSMGSLLRLPVLTAADAAEAASGLAEAALAVVHPATRGGVDPRAHDWSPPTALWVGPEVGEAGNLPADAVPLTIPMAGGVESLNVTVAASLLLFAAGRVAPGGEAAR